MAEPTIIYAPADAMTLEPLPTPPLVKPAPASSSTSGMTGTQIGGAVALAAGVVLRIAAIAARRRRRRGKRPSALLPALAGVAVVAGAGALFLGARSDASSSSPAKI